MNLAHMSAEGVGGAQADVLFDTSRLELTGAAPGSAYAGEFFAVGVDGQPLSAAIAAANATGRLENVAAAGLTAPMPAGTHDFVVLTFTAKNNPGVSAITLTDVLALDQNYDDIVPAATGGWVGVAHATNDGDADGVQDASDNCPSTVNPSQLNNDRNFIRLNPPKAYDDLTVVMSDALGDACDPDDDNDGRIDADEIGGVGCNSAITDPLKADTDGDRALGGPECALGTNPLSTSSAPTVAMCGATTDVDGDGIIARNEYCYYGSDPTSANSDGDGCGDGREMASINADQSVSAIDLGQVAGAFGPYSFGADAYKCNFDLNKDGTVSAIDLNLLQAQFGACP